MTALRSDAPCPPAAGTTQWGSATAATRNLGSSSRTRSGSRGRLRTPASMKTGIDNVLTKRLPFPGVVLVAFLCCHETVCGRLDSVYHFLTLSSHHFSPLMLFHFNMPIFYTVNNTSESETWISRSEERNNLMFSGKWVSYMLAYNWVQVNFHVPLWPFNVCIDAHKPLPHSLTIPPSITH